MDAKLLVADETIWKSVTGSSSDVFEAEHEDRGLQQRGKEVEGELEVRCGLGSRVGESTMRLTIVLQVGVRGCGPPFYVWIKGAEKEREAKDARAASRVCDWGGMR